MTSPRVVRCLLLALLASQPALAQGISGTFTGPSRDGTPITLTLRPAAGNRVGGVLTRAGTTYQIDGQLDGDEVMALAVAGQSGVYLEARRDGAQVRLILADIVAGGQPDYAHAVEVVLTPGTGPQAGGAGAAGAAVGAAGGSAPSGNPLARRPGGAEGDPYVGTFEGSGISLSLAPGGDGYAGALRIQGAEYPVAARRAGEGVTGTFAAGGSTYLFEARLQGTTLSLLSDGQTYQLERGGGGARNPLAAGPQPPGGAPGVDPAGVAAGPQDQQLAQFLLSSRWCHFSYSGISGTSSGSSYQETVSFTPDGLMLVQSGSDSYLGSAYGSVAGQGAGGGRFRWKVQGGTLQISADGIQWQPVPLQISRNSNGHPIVNASGKEYMQCN